jgi:hypothetical protein
LGAAIDVYLGLGDFRPQVFQVIKFALRLQKDMDNHGIVIHQYPLSFFKTFNPQRLNSGLGQGFLHMLGQGRDVAVGTAGAEDEEIRKRTEFGHFQEHRFHALVGNDGPDGQIYQCCRGENG